MSIRVGISTPSLSFEEVSISYTPPPPPEPVGEFDLFWGDDTGITWGADTIIDYPGIS